MCIACVMSSQTCQLPSHGTPEPVGLASWSPDDTARAETVYKQLPRWSRRLFDLLTSVPEHRFPLSEVQASLLAAGDAPFGVDEACNWAAAFCAASSRTLPVSQETPASGEPVYWMEQPAARLFRSLPARLLT